MALRLNFMSTLGIGPFARVATLVTVSGLVSCGGGQSGDLNEDALTAGDHRADAGAQATPDGTPAGDSGKAETPEDASTSSPDPVPPEGSELGNAKLPTKKWRAAFQTGFFEKEELWLLPADSDVAVNVTPEGQPDPDWAWGSAMWGYPRQASRLGSVLFDASRSLLFSTWVIGSAVELRSLNLKTGDWKLWARTPDVPRLHASEAGIALLSWTEQQVQVEVDGKLIPLPVEGTAAGRMQRFQSGERDRLLVGGQLFELSGGAFEALSFPAEVPEDKDRYARATPAGTHICLGAGGEAWLLSDEENINSTFRRPFMAVHSHQQVNMFFLPLTSQVRGPCLCLI